MRPRHHHPGKAAQRGAALMVMLIILVLGLAATLVKSLSSADLGSARHAATAAALAQAKEALIGRAVSDSSMPGSMPCPDTDDDGSAELLSGNDCPSYIGRLPWRTLKLPDLRDGNGEHLWYVLSSSFRDDNSASPLNNNTKGTLLVYGTDGVSTQTQAGYSAVAVIFAPGYPLSTGSPLITQTRNTFAQKNDAANYMDRIVIPGPITRNNASVGGPFIAGNNSATFNDQLLYITTRDLMPLVEQRVAGAVKQALTDYYNANGYYPWADNLLFGGDDYAANDGTNRGWLPRDAAAGGAPDWVAGSPTQWFFDNQWYTLIYYSVARDYTEVPGNCDTCDDNTLSVDGVNGVRALFFMPGTPISTLTRNVENLPDYLEDSQNKDHANDLYVTPTSQAGDRDRLYRLP